MNVPQIYLLFIGCLLIVHRLPGLISPRCLKLLVRGYSQNKITLRITGIVLFISSLSSIIITLFDYFDHGWIVIGLAIIVGHKGLELTLDPVRYGRREGNAWNQSDKNIRIICGLSLLAGAGMILLAFII